MYKRPARLLVAAVSDDGRARRIAELAGQPALATWLEVRPARSMRALTVDDLEWADLLVAVDAAAALECPLERPVTCRLKRWRLPPVASSDFEAEAMAALRGMAGGMRMLARVDEPDAESGRV